MNTCSTAIAFLLLARSLVSASENGGYYTCDATTLASENKCIFALTGTQPSDWVQTSVKHDVDNNVGADNYRGVQSYNGAMLSVSPKPWVNGDKLVSSSSEVTGDDWSYALIFELMAPLRDMMMYEPDQLDETTWKKWTRALTDCNAKTTDYEEVRSGGTPYSTDQVYGYLKDPENNDIHHYILQYLEEGAMDLVCLSTDLEMDHCDTIRDTAGATEGVDRCNCWFDAYEAIYDVCPNVDMAFTTCEGTVAPAVCTDVTGDDDTDDDQTGGANPPEQPSPPAKGGPPAKRRR